MVAKRDSMCGIDVWRIMGRRDAELRRATGTVRW